MSEPVDKKRKIFGDSMVLKDIAAFGRVTYKTPEKCIELLVKNSLAYIMLIPTPEGVTNEAHESNRQAMFEKFYGIIAHMLQYMEDKSIKYSVDKLPSGVLFYEYDNTIAIQSYAHASRKISLRDLETVLNFLDHNTGVIFYMVTPATSDISLPFDSMNDNFVVRCHITSNAPIEYFDFELVDKESMDNKLDVLIDYIVALKKKKYIAKV